jgi:hypothetical protein
MIMRHPRLREQLGDVDHPFGKENSGAYTSEKIYAQ